MNALNLGLLGGLTAQPQLGLGALSMPGMSLNHLGGVSLGHHQPSPAAPYRPQYNKFNKPAPVVSIVKTDTGECPKSVLNVFCQRFLERPVSKTDITFTTTKYGHQFQSICKLHCMSGQEVVGELQSHTKDAEKSAALMCLQVYKEQIEALPAAGDKKDKKRRLDQMTHGERQAKKAKTEENKAAGLVVTSAKMKLHEAAIKIGKRMPDKGEITYDCKPCQGGFQATVRLSCLPEEWKEQLWAGEVKTQKQAAEQSAAEICLRTIESEPILMEKMNEKKPKEAKGKGKGKWGKWGNSWSTAKPVGKQEEGGEGEEGEEGAEDADGSEGGKGTGPTSTWNKRKWPNDPWSKWEAMNGGNVQWGGSKGAGKGPVKRERITEEPLLGEVLEYKGKTGFIKPSDDFVNPDAKKGAKDVTVKKLMVHAKDVCEGCDELTVGALVTFHVYRDWNGLGAEEVIV